MGVARLTLFLKTLFFWSSVRFAPRPWVPSGPCRPGAQPPGLCLARHAGTLRVRRDDPAPAHLVTRSPRPAWGGGFSLGVVRSAGLEEGVTMVPVTGVPRGAPPRPQGHLAPPAPRSRRPPSPRFCLFRGAARHAAFPAWPLAETSAPSPARTARQPVSS